MPTRIVRTVTVGTPSHSEYVFSELTIRLIGRDADCDPQVPDDEEHRVISRLHCTLDINPPQIRIRDLGSKFDTFLNETMIVPFSGFSLPTYPLPHECSITRQDSSRRQACGGRLYARVDPDTAANTTGADP